MRNLETIVSTLAFVAAVGFAGTAMAGPADNLLANPGAELGTNEVPDNWTPSGVVGAAGRSEIPINGVPVTGERNGDWFFTTALVGVGNGGSASLDQDVDISGCSVFGIPVGWSATGWYETQDVTPADFGTVDIDFNGDGGLADVASSSLTNVGSYAMFDLSGSFVDSTSVNYKITGTEGGAFNVADVGFDDLFFSIDCVADFAKISGVKEQGEGKGRGNDPEFAFSGAVGTLEGGSFSGIIVINYRQLGPTSCEFTATDISYDGSGGATVTADYECKGGDKDTDTGTATIDLTDKDAVSLGCPGKDRGSVAVTASDSDLDIAGSDGNTGGENCLAKGNVIIDDDVTS